MEHDMMLMCPGCNRGFAVESENPPESFTCDCPVCGLLILVEDGNAKDFHAAMHKEIEAWPADGRGATYIEC